MQLEEILHNIKNGALDINEAARLIKNIPDLVPLSDDLGYAVVDHQRKKRTGASEVIYCAGKTPFQTEGIIKNMLSRGTKNILATRADRQTFDYIYESVKNAEYNEAAKTITIIQEPVTKLTGTVLVVSAGTSDIPVAEEAIITAEFHGCNIEKLYDVGVAGLHRLLSRLEAIQRSSVIIVVAGMEGALASVVGGLTDKPVIAVPTSIGYGASFGGLAALLSMLNSCASGVSVVNIDNGFGAGMIAYKIISLLNK